MARAIPLAVALSSVLALTGTALANVRITVVSQDPYTNTSSYHQTEVEPDTFAFGTTILSDFQVGRFTDGGASNIGWSRSTDSGLHWSSGFAPSLTIYSTPPGTFKRATDPSVAYDRKHNVWMLGILGSNAASGFVGNAILASRSTDGGATFGGPITVKTATGGQNYDKTWVACDNTPTSPFYGNCYFEWDDNGSGNLLKMSRSTDGGLTWTDSTVPANQIVIGGQPLTQPNGTVVVPTDDGFESSAESYVSTNGGASYTGPFSISSFQQHFVAGGLRSPNLISAEVDGAGKIYVVFYDCRFRSGCSSNDIVMSTSTNGQTWTPVVRIPIDPTSSTVDHFLPGIGVDVTTSGATAKLGVNYYYYPQANCSATTCQLDVGFISSSDGGASWSAARQLSGPFTLTWLPNTTQGYMVGDYNSVSWIGGHAHTVYAAAQAGTCQLGQITTCHEPMVAPRVLLGSDPAAAVAGLDRPVAGWHPNVPRTTLKSNR